MPASCQIEWEKPFPLFAARPVRCFCSIFPCAGPLEMYAAGRTTKIKNGAAKLHRFIIEHFFVTAQTAINILSERSVFYIILAGLEGGALGVLCFAGSVSAYVNMLGLTVTAFVINAVYGLTVNLQTAFGCLEDVFKGALLVLVKASAAGLGALLCAVSVHNNRLLAAAVVCIVQTVGNRTV